QAPRHRARASAPGAHPPGRSSLQEARNAMRRWGDVLAMISEPAIDKRTEEKMFFGTLDPEDAPPEFARVAVLLRAAALPRTDAPSGSLITDTDKLRQQPFVAAMAPVIAATPAVVHGHGYWKGMSALRPRRAVSLAPGHRFWKAMSALRPGRAARLALVMALGLMVVSARMAVSGVLPSPVQHAASVLFSKVGVHVPDGGTGQGTGSGKEPGSSSGHDKVTGSGDHGNHKDKGKHTGQEKNGNRGLHKGHGKDGHEGHHGHHAGDGHEAEGGHGHHGGGGHEGAGGHDGSGSSGGGDSHDGGSGSKSGSGHDGSNSGSGHDGSNSGSGGGGGGSDGG